MDMLTYLIILLPILYQVKSPINVMSLGELLLTPFIIWGFLKMTLTKKKISIPKGLNAFYFIPILTTMFALIVTRSSTIDSSITVIVRIFYYYALILICQKNFTIKKAIKLYLVIGTFMSIYLIIQVAAHYFTTIEMPIPLNYPELLFQRNTLYTSERYYGYFGFRPASLFTEPSYYANYIAPLIAIILFKGKEYNIFSKWNRRIFFSVFLSVTIVLSTSSLGILYIAVIWISFIFSNSAEIGLKRKYKYPLIITITVGVFFALGTELFSASISRFSSGSSIGPRLIRGFIIYSKLNPIQQLIGVGLNNIGNYVSANSIYTIYDETDLNYTVTLTNRLIATGLIGLIALLYFWVKQFKEKKGIVFQTLLFLMLVSFVFANGEYTSEFPFLFIILNAIYT